MVSLCTDKEIKIKTIAMIFKINQTEDKCIGPAFFFFFLLHSIYTTDGGQISALRLSPIWLKK